MRPGRLLSSDVVKALSFWPGFLPVPHAPVDLTVLPPFFNDLLAELPWWNPAWRVTQVRPAAPCVATVVPAGFTEVAVPGEAAAQNVDPLPFVARVRFHDDRLIRFQAKIGDMVIGPGATPPGNAEPDQFAAVIRTAMDVRRVSVRTLAMQCGLSMSTINALRGGWSPDPTVAERVASALGIPLDELDAPHSRHIGR
jgi:lambda repressor-like predicted transcriptional regulator